MSPFDTEPDRQPCKGPERQPARGLATAAPATLLSVRGLDVRYGGRTALKNVDLDVPEGRVTALVGPSGCGKTTFLFALNRLADFVAGCCVSGSIRFDGEEIGSNTDVGWLRRNIGTVFQRPNPFPISIERNLHLPLREHGTPRAELDGRTQELLERVGLWTEVKDRLGDSALRLSGGQQQRLCLARALTLDPRMILMDEPCSSLDPVAAEHVEELIDRLRGTVTVVLVTHNLAQARRLADRVGVFWNRDGWGTVIESGDADELFESPQDSDTAAYLSGRRG